MQRALELAALGRGYVSPNPLVGSVVVHEGVVIGEGWHKKYGGPHAEVNAIAGVADRSLLPNSTVYVNLEPCSHTGKTPPCADLLIREKVKRVVVANLDSNPLVAGEGIKKLRAAGIEVITGILDKEGRALNKRFFTAMEKQRPYIILKWAQTADGFVARENYDARWISNPYSRQLVHKWRTEEDAFIIGQRTAQYDNPQLNVRDWTGRNPTRIVIDRFLKLSPSLTFFNGAQPTVCYNLMKHEEHTNLTLARLPEQDFLQHLIQDLFRRKLHSVVVEGGGQTLEAFIEAGLWDEARVFQSTQAFGKGIPAPQLQGIIAGQARLHTDTLTTYVPRSLYNHSRHTAH